MNRHAPDDAASAIGLTPPPAAAAHPVYSSGYLRWVLVMLLAANTVNFMDRQMLAVLQQAIKHDLLLTDTQLGLVSGLTFALFFATLGVPIARLAERHSRVWILSGAVFLWSGMTTLCGTTQNFAQLVLFRVGLGVGEAGCTPSAHSLIGDYFSAERRATAISIYTLGLCIGIFLGATISGSIAEAWGWRAAFMVVGLPGLLLAVLIRLTVREPPRGYSEPVGSRHFGKGTQSAPSIGTFLRYVGAKRAVWYLIAGHTFAAFAIYGVSAFGPSYFARQFDMGLAQVGLIAGVTGGIFAGVGTLIGGFGADWLGRHDRRYYAWMPVAGLVIAAPLYMSAYLVEDWRVAVGLLALANVAHFTYLAPMFGALNIIMEPRMRATAAALILLVSGILGNGMGPVAVGAASDFIANYSFGAGDFGLLCRGGGSTASPVVAACKAASASGLQYAIVACAAVYILAGLQFVLAGRTIRADMEQ